jgi:leader peptidase (prepilin peptidase) / N-methyltransferase
MEMEFGLLVALILGAIFGSFNGLLIHRLPDGGSIVFTRSACPKCKNHLRARDLIPLLSWLISRGKCRFCSTSISVRYPLLELATALLFAGAYAMHGATMNALLIALLASHLLVVCIIDIQHRIIPDCLQIIIATLGLIYALHNQHHVSEIVGGGLLGATIGLGLQLLVRIVKKQEGLGMGDVKFMAASGLWLGTSLLPYYFYAGVIGVVSALLWRMVNDDPRFPFAPALATSLLLLVIYPPSREWQMQLSVKIVTMLGII